MTMPTPGALFGMIIFGAIGLAAFGYGKKEMSLRPMVVGVALMIYPYFVTQTWCLYGVGVLLTTALFVPRN